MTDLELYSRKEVVEFLEKLSFERKSRFDALEQQMRDENLMQRLSEVGIKIESQQNRKFLLDLTTVTMLFLLGLVLVTWSVDGLFIA